jgi:hypothetical protein
VQLCVGLLFVAVAPGRLSPQSDGVGGDGTCVVAFSASTMFSGEGYSLVNIVCNYVSKNFLLLQCALDEGGYAVAEHAASVAEILGTNCHQKQGNTHALKKSETNLYHELLHCFVKPSLYFLLYTPV